MRRSAHVIVSRSVAPHLLSQPLWRRAAASPEDAGVGSGTGVASLAEPVGPAMLTVRRTAGDDVQDRQVYLSHQSRSYDLKRYSKSIRQPV